jgi:PPOX class probable F420-dependent enzyme
MTNAEREAFLATPRLGILATLQRDGSPIAVPVWFEWDGAVARVFSSAASPKLRRLERDARASLLVTNAIGEAEAWVAFDGAITVATAGAIELAERLAERDWDMNIPAHRETVAAWRGAAARLRVLTLSPSQVRSSAG